MWLFLCSFFGFSIFDARAVFSTVACLLFPPWVLVIIPLIGVKQMQVTNAYSWGFSVVVVQAHP